jgi:hypothetical protein
VTSDLIRVNIYLAPSTIYLDNTLKELMKYEIILHHKGGNTFSLNPKQKKLINSINDQIGE